MNVVGLTPGDDVDASQSHTSHARMVQLRRRSTRSPRGATDSPTATPAGSTSNPSTNRSVETTISPRSVRRLGSGDAPTLTALVAARHLAAFEDAGFAWKQAHTTTDLLHRFGDWRQRAVIVEMVALPPTLHTVWISGHHADVLFVAEWLIGEARTREIVYTLAHVLLSSVECATPISSPPEPRQSRARRRPGHLSVAPERTGGASFAIRPAHLSDGAAPDEDIVAELASILSTALSDTPV